MPEPQAPEAPDITDALPKLMPEIRRVTLTGWALEGAIAVVTVAILILTAGTGEEPYQILLIVLVVAAVLASSVARYTRGQHEARLMPTMAEAASLG